jgi:hypothetical protein
LRWVVVVADQDALAAHGVVRLQLRALAGIGHLPRQVAAETAAHQAHQPGQADEGQRTHLVVQVLEQAVDALQQRHAAHQGDFPGAIGAIRLVQHVGGRALEQAQLRHFRLDLRDELDCRGASADHRHALAGQIQIMPPARRVKGLAAKALHPRQLRIGRAVELAAGADQRLGLQAFAADQLDPPQPARGVELGALHLGVEANLRTQPVLVHALQDIGVDFRLRRVLARPVVLGLEGKRIEVRRHVAGGARIVVVAPGAADLAGLFQQQEVVLAGLAQLHGQAQAGEAAADDQHAPGRARAGVIVHCGLPDQ